MSVSGDGMDAHSGMAFSTKDKDQDTGTQHCADNFKGAFWYRRCYEFHPNGLYMPGSTSSNAMNIRLWPDSKVAYTGLKATRMAIRPL